MVKLELGLSLIDEVDDDIKLALIRAHQTIQQLTDELDTARRTHTQVTHQLKQLQAQNLALYDKNQEYRKSLIRLEQTSYISHDESCVSSVSTSPSEGLRASFNSFQFRMD